VELTDGQFDVAFRFPAISVRGYRVAYGDDFEDDPLFAIDVKIADVRTGVQRKLDAHGDQVSSVRVAPEGAVGWISCTSDMNVSPFPGARSQDCVRPSRTSRSFVYRALPHGQPVLLDSGRDIEQFSLRLSGHTLSWVHSGRRRQARLR